MAMSAGEIERLIRAAIPDAKVAITDLAGDFGCVCKEFHGRRIAAAECRVTLSW
jgi:hypothetical protein